MPKQISGAQASEAVVCNQLDPPVAGVNVGKGLHVIIPVDFVARILSGEKIAGCTYASVESDGTMVVDDVVLTRINDSQATSGLNQTAVSSLKAKISLGIVIASLAIEGAT